MLKRLLRRPAAPPSLPQDPDQVIHPAAVSDEGFAASVRASSLLTVVDFWAEWCQPCDTMAEWLQRLATEYPGQLRVLALDVDENPKTPERYGVLGLPTLILFQDGVEVHRTTGVSTYESLKRDVNRLLENRAT
jgi:thioredoxin 1